MAPRDFRAELRREDQLRREQGLSPAARARLWSRLRDAREPKPARHKRLVWLMLAAPAAALALAVFFWSAPSARSLGGLELAQATPGLRVREDAAGVEIQTGEAALVDDARGLALRNLGPLVVRREPSGVRLVRGRAEFSVERRKPGALPAVVLVSGGAIEVMGTRFTVEEREVGGAVTLHEGAILFRRLTGEVVQLRPGQTLGWPVEVVSPEPEPPQPLATPGPVAASSSPPTAAARAPSVGEILRELEVLRGRHEFEQAARYLEAAMRKQPAATRERLSFELGSLLTYQLEDAQRACAHWARHERQFQRGRYAESVQRARETLSCQARDGETGR
ncbi:FecR domain-containing protein [Archangium sp. Cb G35]|uniref:FecR domain-containing protein n=1 Tax=Archangium sp. Cb G35 TaxID=1920190 RepID=UPI000AF328E8|nr:FecR domain-containing protein [Archangium sp. Cb G35]